MEGEREVSPLNWCLAFTAPIGHKFPVFSVLDECLLCPYGDSYGHEGHTASHGTPQPVFLVVKHYTPKKPFIVQFKWMILLKVCNLLKLLYHSIDRFHW